MHSIGTPQLLPQLGRQMGSKRCQKHQQVRQRFDCDSITTALEMAGDRIAELHQLGDGGVELIRILEVFADRFDRRVDSTAQFDLIGVGRLTALLSRDRGLGTIQTEPPLASAVDLAPDPLQKAELPLDIGVVPLQILLGGALNRMNMRAVSAP